MLDDLDWELDRRGHKFVRYADDGRIYVRSRAGGRAGHGEHHAICRAAPEAQVNRQKSAVAPAAKRPLLGFEFFRDAAVRLG